MLTNKLITLALSLASIFSLASAQECLSLLQSAEIGVLTGSFELMSGKSKGRSTDYDVNLPANVFNSSFEVSLSIVFMSNYKSDSGTDFTITSSVKGTGFLAVLFMGQTMQWSSIHVHYLATGIDHLRTGYFPAQSPALLNFNEGTKGSQVVTVQHFLGDKKGWRISPRNVILYVFLNGIRTEDNDFNLDISESFYDSDKKSISLALKFENIHRPVETLTISYILTTPVGPVAIKLIPDSLGSLIKRLNKQERQDDRNSRKFIGMKGIKGEYLVKFNGQRRMLVENLDLYDEKTVEIFHKTFDLRTIDILNQDANPNILTNTFLPESVGNIVFNGKTPTCISFEVCERNGGKFVLLKNEKIACVACANRKQFDVDNEKCVCQEGYIVDGEQCKTVEEFCGRNNVYQDGSCYQLVKVESTIQICKENQVFNAATKKCECKPGYEASLVVLGESFCVLKCSGNSVYNIQTLKCECPVNQEFKNGVCKNCTSLEKYNSQTKSCNCAEGVSKTLSGECVVCFGNSHFNESIQKCECDPGYTGTFCRKAPTLLRSNNQPVIPLTLGF